MRPRFFRSPAELRRWLEGNHDRATELWIGFHRVGTGKPGPTYREALDEALCFGWIDGVRRRIDDTSYTNRFSPRKPGSNWSRINIARVEELRRLGRMHPAGLAAFEARTPERSGVYSYERGEAWFEPGHERRFRANEPAWRYFQGEAPWYRRTAAHWVASAKREETRLRRLDALIEACEQRTRVGPLRTTTGR